MKNKLKKILTILEIIIQVLVLPICKNKVFFLNIIVLIVLPSMINAYWVNRDVYVTISSIYKYGIIIRYGASVPYIFFIPFVLAYIVSLIGWWTKKLNIKIALLYKLLVYIILMFLFVVNIFCLMNFKTMLSPAIVMLMAETNRGETLEFFKSYLFNFDSLQSYLIIAILLIWLLYSEKRQVVDIQGKRTIVLLLSLTLYMFQRSVSPFQTFIKMFACKNLTEVELWYLKYPVNTNVVSNVIYSSFVMQLSKEEMGDAARCTLSMNEHIEAKEMLNLILIIGESFSKHHSSLYGYKHHTNPKLEARVKSNNLFVFNDVISAFNLTSFVLRNLFSVNSIMDGENWADFPSFPIMFKKSGYDVYFWDNQRTFGNADVSDFSIASYLFNDSVAKASYTKYNEKTFSYDGELVTDFWDNVYLKSTGNLIIFHIMGQHTMPDKRYPSNSQFNYFSADSINRPDLDVRRRTLIAHYDNATLYNDWLINSIIEHYDDDNAVVIYLSDHGEEIYDFRDHYGRTQESIKTAELLKYQYEIPFMIWCSDTYKARHPIVMNNIAAAVDKPFMNDNVCQILFGLVEMSTQYYHPERDLLSPQFQPYNHRNVQNTINYEQIRWRLK
jgi:heptose-I-phosphate ethanolaminephosphotransferase